VEGKNWTVVRQYVGYARYAGDLARLTSTSCNRDLRLYVNFFQPVMKLKEKIRVDGKVKKVYDTAQTPYQRCLPPATSARGEAEAAGALPTLNP